MTKNVKIVDEQGRQYGATFPKRAKGLVKKGRARFISDDTICLACPPDILEDQTMLDKVEGTVWQGQTETTAFNAEYIIKQIEKITSQQDELMQTLKQVESLEADPSDVTGVVAAKAKAMQTIIEKREETNQQLINLYEKMYDDQKPQQVSIQDKALDLVTKMLLSGTANEENNELLLDALEAIRHLN